MTDAQQPQPDAARPPVAPPVPPYAASPGFTPGAYPAPGSVAQGHPHPGAVPVQNTPQQAYPGAPPTWGGYPTPPPAQPGGGSSVLAIIALVLAILGALASFIPFAGLLAAGLLLLPAIVLAIIALVRRAGGKGLSIAALVIAGVGGLVALLWTAALALFGGLVGGWGETYSDSYEEEDYSYPSLGAPDTDAATRADALPFGESIFVVDENSGEDVWQMTVTAPEDLTAEASAASGIPPENGAFVSVAVELTNIGDEPIDLTNRYEYRPYAWMLTGDGGRAETTYWTSTEDRPDVTDIGVVEPGDTVTYYEVFDVAAGVAATGYFVVDLDSGIPVFWGPPTVEPAV